MHTELHLKEIISPFHDIISMTLSPIILAYVVVHSIKNKTQIPNEIIFAF
jgi:hypothetical protein